MDFEYQKWKDSESHQQEERIDTYPKPTPRATFDQETKVSSQRPPVKPRRSIKYRSTAQQGPGSSAPPTSQRENVTASAVKRVAPALVLGPTGPLEALSPSLRAHTLLWFERTQLPRLRTAGQPLPCWLHGFATRREAEQLLQDKPQGCFLLRLSESKIGFVLSYRGEDRCRHFIIEEEESGVPGVGGQYVIAGENSRHGSLEELISYYTHNPVGPFNERLTVPCVESKGGCEDVSRAALREAVGEETRPSAPLTLKPPLQPPPPDCPVPSVLTPPAAESPEYAVVRKALKKTRSLPESTSIPDTLPPVSEVLNIAATQESVMDSVASSDGGETGACGGADLSDPQDAAYAKVNKPPRAVPRAPSSVGNQTVQQGAPAPSRPVGHASAAEQKYWELEPMHTYEETPRTWTRDGQIDFYAVGRRVPGGRDGADCASLHLYSEVNIKGSRPDASSASAPPPVRAAPDVPPTNGLPLRPCPRSVQLPARSDSGEQVTSPMHSDWTLTEGSASSIYEQIPERPTSKRPPLPPPNPKR